LPWGRFYNEHKTDKLNAATLEQCIVAFIDDDDVDNRKWEVYLRNMDNIAVAGSALFAGQEAFPVTRQ
jgi:hypothetical protein